MSLNSALSSAVSGLRAQSATISTVSENIANASTTAYKTKGVSFQSLVTGNNSASSSSGGGVITSTYQNVSSQGEVVSVDSSTSIAINGQGFFVVSEQVDNQPSAYVYSRNGDFSEDANGYLINTEGYYLLGQRTDADGNVVATNANDLNSLEVIDTNTISGSAAATQNVTVDMNLPADADVGSVYTTSVEIFDSLGVSHTIDINWEKTAANEWTATFSNPYLTSDGSGGADSGVIDVDGAGGNTIDVVFNGDGSLSSLTPTSDAIQITGFSATTGADDATINFDLGTSGLWDGLTQYSSTTTDPDIEITQIDQDGVRYGQLSSIEIDDTGLVTAYFDNGLRQAIYQIPIATFSNPSGLTHINGTIYDENQNAGNYNLTLPGEGSAGTVVANALESSTTDTSTEFNRMIVAQQAYSAAAQVVSTVKDMFDTLISVVR